jgi:zinc protease
MIDRGAPPPLATPRRAALPPIQHARLANGLRILLVESHDLPLVHLQLGSGAGGEWDPPARAGLATLTAALRDEGTTRRTSTEIAAAIEDLGGHLSTTAGWEASYISTVVLAQAVGPALELMAEVAREATFPETEFERLRRQRLADLLHRRSQPAALADERLVAEIYGEGLYGYPLSGDEATTSALELADAIAFASRRFSPATSWLIAVGAVSLAELERRSASLLADWRGGDPASETPVPVPRPRAGLTVDVIDRPGSAQTELRMGQVGMPKLHPDRVPLGVGNSLLGGKFTSRINLNLRERRGITYGAFSRLADRRHAGLFSVGGAVATERGGEAVREILGELERLRQEPPGDLELSETRDYLVGVFPYQLQTGDDLARRLEELATYDLPDDHAERRLAEIQAVTGAEIQRAAAAYLRPDAMAIVAAGSAAELVPQLSEFAEVRVSTPGAPRVLRTS